MIDQEQTSALLMLIADMRLQIARLHAENAMLRTEFAQRSHQEGALGSDDTSSAETIGGDANPGAARGH